MGRAARHLNGRAILYADVFTDSMKRAIDETNRRRAIQEQYNEQNNIIPQSIIKPIDMSLVAIAEGDYVTVPVEPEDPAEEWTPEQTREIHRPSWKKACAMRQKDLSLRKPLNFATA